MSTRTVRLDEEAEKALEEIRKETGMSISEALKQGLLVLRGQVVEARPDSPWQIYERLELGYGDDTIPPAAKAKRAVREALARKHRPRKHR